MFKSAVYLVLTALLTVSDAAKKKELTLEEKWGTDVSMVIRKSH